MNNNKDVELSILLYKYMVKNKIIKKNCINKKEEQIETEIDMDINFKEKLKQHFKVLALTNKNDASNIFTHS
jgi:hypothetical protein